MIKLAPCRRCHRHCRTTENACPFCGARRVAIGAGVLAVATLAVGWSCETPATTPRDSDTPPQASSSNVIAPVDAGAVVPVPSVPPPDQNRAAPMYGLPVPPPDPPHPTDQHRSAAPMYGLAPVHHDRDR